MNAGCNHWTRLFISSRVPQTHVHLHLKTFLAIRFIGQCLDLVSARGEVCLKDRLPTATHVCQHTLTEVPAQNLIWDAAGVCRVPAGRFKNAPINSIFIRGKRNNLIAVLYCVSIAREKKGPPRVQTSGFIEKKYWSKAECRSPFINSPFWTELIFDMPVVSFIFVIHLEYPNWFQRSSLSRGNTWAASSFVHTPELASKLPWPEIMHFLSRSRIPSRKALSHPEIL